MITNEHITPLADDAAARYGAVVQIWQGAFAQAAAASDLGQARSFHRTELEAHGVASAYLRRERETLSEALADIAYVAQEAALRAIGVDVPSELTDAASEAVSASREHLSHELIVQTARDVAFLVRALRQQALQVSLAARSQRIPMNAAIMQSRIGARGRLDFVVSDRGGAKWASRKFVRTLIRHAMLSVYNDVTLITLAEHGLETARVEHLNGKAEVHGLVIAMGANSEHPTYAEIRAEVFHPNADAIVVPDFEVA